MAASERVISARNTRQIVQRHFTRRELDGVVKKVVKIIGDAAKKSFPKYRYVEKVHEIRQWANVCLPKIDTKKLSVFDDEEFFFETRKSLPSEYSDFTTSCLNSTRLKILRGIAKISGTK